MAKGKGTNGRSGGPWKGGPQRGKTGQQPFSPRTTKATSPRPPRRDRGAAQTADSGQAGKPANAESGAPRRGPRAAGGDEGFARAGRAQPGKPGPTQRVDRPPREGGKANKPWASRPAKERRAEQTAQAERSERDERIARPLAPRRTERSEIRPPRENASSPLRLPRSPAPTGGPTPLERRRAYRYGGEVAVDRDVVYGRNAVAETLRAGRRKARRLLLTEGSEEHKTAGEIATLAASCGVEVEYLSRTELERRAPGVNHQGAVLEVGPYRYADYDDLLAAVKENPNALLLVLDSVQDPQNLGTLLRTAEAAGVTGIVIPEHRAVQVTPAVVNASAGAVEHLPVAVVTNLVRAVEQAKEAGAWAVAAEAVPDAALPSEVDFTGPLVLVVGSEGQGVGRLLRETCDLTVRIPLVGKVGSLNVATAGSILLYEVVRQRMEDASMSALVSTLSEGETD
jgi:23S rRNA (guanosine2251-2'-O)-methyltransferase